MKLRTTMLLSIIVLSLALGVVMAQQPTQYGQAEEMSATTEHAHKAMGYDHSMMAENHSVAEENYAVMENKPESKTSDGVNVYFSAQSTIHVSELASVQMNITDEKSTARLSHVDWAIVVKDPRGNVVYKTTTAHSHVGVMDFKLAFPLAGENMVSLTTSSIGQKMSGMEVELPGRTHTMISGGPKGFKTDPENDFGARTFEFPVYVQPKLEKRTLVGTESETSVNIAMQSMSNEIIAGRPTSLVFTVTKASDDSMITHPDLHVTLRTGSYTPIESAPVSGMMAMQGAVHGHTGVMTFTTTFPTAGHYVIDVDLQPSPLSNYMWGHAKTRFDLFVSEPTGTAVNPVEESAPPANTVNIIGLEAPFFTPNSINIKAGTSITFVNTDGNAHTVTSVKSGTIEPDGTFDSGIMTAGKTFTFKFDKAGTYEYICQIHTHMRGTINVS